MDLPLLRRRLSEAEVIGDWEKHAELLRQYEDAVRAKHGKPRRVEDRELLNLVKSIHCLICGRPADPAHVQTRGSGGDDVANNVMPLCRGHHDEQSRRGWVFMYETYSVIRYWFMAVGREDFIERARAKGERRL